MADTTYVASVTKITADTMNDLNRVHYTILGDPANAAAVLAAVCPNSAALAAALSDETGTGANVFATSPTLVTPALGTPASGVLTNCTGYPGTSALVVTGALNSGSITSGFGSIDIGTDTLAAGNTSITGTLSTTSSVTQTTSGITATHNITAGTGYGATFTIKNNGGVSNSIIISPNYASVSDLSGFIENTGAGSLYLRIAGSNRAELNSAGLAVTGNVSASTRFDLPSYTVGTLPAVGTAAGMIYVSNESGGAVPAFSDGTNWRRVTDRAIVS